MRPCRRRSKSLKSGDFGAALNFQSKVIMVKGVTTSTSYEYELRVSENKVQLKRIRDENGKFRSNSVSILNVTFA